MKTAIILDFETTSADPLTARPWEFHAMMVKWQDGRWADIAEGGSRMWSYDYEPITEGAMRACKLKVNRFDGVPTFKSYMTNDFLPLLASHPVDYFIAYNAQFDRTILETEAQRQGVELPEIKWLCAMNDVDYEPHYRCKQLSHLALDHGIKVNPEELHGAAGDVRLLSQLLRNYSLDDMIAFAASPWVFIKAILPDPWGATKAASEKLRAIAKKEGFGWEGTRVSDRNFPKTWVKAVKAHKLDAELSVQRPYPVQQIGD